MYLPIPLKFCDAYFWPTYDKNYGGFPLNAPLRFPLNVPHTNSNFGPILSQNGPKSAELAWKWHKSTKTVPKSEFGAIYQNFIFDHFSPKFDPLGSILVVLRAAFQKFSNLATNILSHERYTDYLPFKIEIRSVAQ